VEPARQRHSIRLAATDRRGSSQFHHQFLFDAGRLPLDCAGWRPVSVHLYAEQARIHSGPGGATEAISTHFKYPYVYQFNLSVQRQLPGRVTLTAAYVGALSHDLPNFIDVNYAPYSTAFGTPSTSATSVADRRQFDPCVGACPKGAAAINNGTGILGASIVDLLSNLTASYHSLQISASKQLSRNFSVSGFYVWSHAIDSFEPDADGLSSPQDSGYFGTPFTPTTTLWAPSAADSRRKKAI
jgi:hypothetical protein